MTLNYRRAKFVYEGARLAAMAAEAPIVPEPYDDREEAFRSQFEKVIERQMGPECSSNAEQLHEDWVRAYEKMGWVYGPERDVEKKTHPDMVPYDKLGHLERDKDAVFVALCEIARKWIHEPGVECDDKQELEKRVAELKAEVERLRGAWSRASGILLRAEERSGEAEIWEEVAIARATMDRTILGGVSGTLKSDDIRARIAELEAKLAAVRQLAEGAVKSKFSSDLAHDILYALEED